MFDPFGGSTLKYTGKNLIDTLTAICAGALMLETLGEIEAACAVQAAVKTVTGKIDQASVRRKNGAHQMLGR